MDRYSRQVLVGQIGPSGQEALGRSRAVVVGCGALGTVVANNLVRAGVGYVRIIDRDFVELDNLQRQILFDEEDATRGMPKAVAAAERLRKVNSSIQIEAVVSDVHRRNIEGFIKDANVVLDATDNFETRFLLNDACFKHSVPWVYGAAIASYGMTMNIIPRSSPCFRSIVSALPASGSVDTCDTVGVLNSITGIVASLQSNEALKIMVGGKAEGGELIAIDLGNNKFEKIHVKERSDCPLCVKGEYEFLDKPGLAEPVKLCGRDMIQVTPQTELGVSLEYLKEKLERLGEVSFLGALLRFNTGKYEMTIFPDGRAFIKGTDDKRVAKSLYARFVGA
jgi:molybdopterin/thiamine biosynthesis adenylyltransferase